MLNGESVLISDDAQSWQNNERSQYTCNMQHEGDIKILSFTSIMADIISLRRLFIFFTHTIKVSVMNSIDILVIFGSGIFDAAIGALAAFEFISLLVITIAISQIVTGSAIIFIQFLY
ncbi:MAG: hypothetical protein ACSLEN_01260 [Candidatus Malihini olakiniferum]